MLRLLAFASVVTLALGARLAAQEPKSESNGLKKEIELLKRELDLLKRENDLLKKENAELKDGAGPKKAKLKNEDGEKEPVTTVTVRKVEYVYQGLTREGAAVTVNVLATSQDGDQKGPHGSLVIIGPEGERYVARPVGGGLRPTTLKEGVPTRLAWSFPKNATGTPPPSAKLTRFNGVMIYPVGAEGGDPITFRNVPAEIVKPKGK
jgi:hypothetical protein